MSYKVFLKHGVTRWAALSALSLKTILIAKEPLDGFEKKGETILKEPIATKKRENYIDWTTYFMATAFLARHRSKDPHYQVGACIVDGDKKIVGIGWNGRPTGVSDDAFTWGKGDETLDNKHTYVCHAEANAIAFRTTVNVKDCILYVTLLPCNECAKMIIQSGIKKVYYFCEEKTSDKFMATKPMFDKAGVDYIEYKPKLGKVDLTFSSENLSNK